MSEVLAELRRARVQPVHVLDEEQDRCRPARAQEDVAQEPQGPLLELGRGEAFDELRRRRDAEEMGEEGQRLLSLHIELLEPLGDVAAYILG